MKAYIENPVLKRDLKLNFHINNLIIAIIIRLLCIGFLFLLVLLAKLGSGILALIIAQIVMIAFFAPASINYSFTSIFGRCDMQRLSFTRLRPITIILGKIASSNIYNIIVILISHITMIIISISSKKFGISGIAYGFIVTIVTMFMISAISSFFCIIFHRNIYASTFLSYIIILFLLGSVIIVVPFIGRIDNQQAKNFLTKSSLYANPIIILTRSLGKIDIMRTDYMYDIADPIVGRGFSYPNWRVACAIYFFGSIIPLSIAILLSNKRKYWIAD